MTDDLDPSRLLASAALDDEVTADERAQVAASASLTAEMEAYAGLRDELAHVDVPASARESAIAAALAVFDAIQSGTDASSAETNVAVPAAAALATPAPPPPNTNVVSLQARRQRQYRWVGGAAAAAVVAVLGIAVVNGSRGSDDQKSSATIPALRGEANDSTEKVSAAATTVPSAATAEAPAPAAAETATVDSAATDAAGGAQAAATTAAASETTAAETLEAATETTEAAADSTFDPWAGARDFNNADDLAAYARSPESPVALPTIVSANTAADTTATTEATETTSAGTVPAPPPPFGTALPDSLYPCDTGDLPVAPINWMGQRAMLVRNEPLGQFQVVSAATCEVLIQVPIA